MDHPPRRVLVAALAALALVGGACEEHGALDPTPPDGPGDVDAVIGADALDVAPDVALDGADPDALATDTVVAGDAGDAVEGEDTGDSAGPDAELPAAPEPLDPTEAASMFDLAAWLFSGADPPQRGVGAGAIDPRRVAIVLGEVLDPNGVPVPGVTVRVHRHAALGETRTDAAGRWALAVNGGGPLVLRFERVDRPPVDRAVDVAWGAWEHLDPVVLTPRAAEATAVALGGSASADPVVVPGALVDDGDGLRRALLLVKPASHAVLRGVDGSARPLSRLDLRVTELSVGARGPLALPALLPPGTAYAWAAELTADEALAAEVAGVALDRDAVLYVEDFTGLPVGGAVPAARYDRERAAWVPIDDGAIVAIAALGAEEVGLDLDGDGLAEPVGAAHALGVGAGERRRLGALYRPGTRLWRVPLRALGTYAIGWPYVLDASSVPPSGVPVADPERAATCREADRRTACDDQVLGAEIPLAGSGFSLVYRSDRTPGGSARGVDVPLVGEPVPADLARVRLDVQVDGERQDVVVTPTSRAAARVLWSGHDGFGRAVVGGASAVVRVRYDYRARYLAVPRERAAPRRAFGLVPPGSRSSTMPVRGPGVTLERRTRLPLSRLDARETGVAGWTLAPHHHYDVVARQILLGSGGREGSAPGLLAVASGGDVGAGAVLAQLAFHRDGAAWTLAEGAGAGLARAVGGADPEPYFGGAAGCAASSPDGTPVAAACVPVVDAFAFGPEGELVFAEPQHLRRVTDEGVLETVAGASFAPGAPRASVGDGGPARAAIFARVAGLAIASDGAIYFSEAGPACPGCPEAQVRRVGTDGLVERVAGTGVRAFSGDGGPAVAAAFDTPTALAFAADGALLVLDSGNRRVRRVGLDGVVTTVAGVGRAGDAGEAVGDGGPAIDALLDGLSGLAVDRDGACYFQARDGATDRAFTGVVDLSGRLRIAAGLGAEPLVDGALAVGIAQAAGGEVAISPRGDPWLARAPGGIRLHAPFPRGFDGDILVPGAGGRERYRFNERGRHLDTRDPVTDAVVRAFIYDGRGHLVAIEEADGRRTVIERDAAGRPTAVVAVDAERTRLETDPRGWLAAVVAPDGARTEVEHDDEGRLVGLSRPGDAGAAFAFGPGAGETRVVGATDALGGVETVARALNLGGFAVTAASRAGRPWRVDVETAPGHDEIDESDDAGLRRVVERGGDGAEEVGLADGAAVRAIVGPSPRDRMRAPELRGAELALPSGAGLSMAFTRAVTPREAALGPWFGACSDEAAIAGEVWLAETTATPAPTRVVSSPEGRVTTFAFDARGRLVSAGGAGAPPVAWARGAGGAITGVTVAAGADAASLGLAWDNAGELATLTLPSGEPLGVLARDPARRPTRALLPGGREAAITWDARGNPTSFTAPGGGVHRFTWDKGDRLVAYEPPAAALGGALALTQDPDGLLTRFAYANGPAVDLVWDLAGRLTTVSTPRGAIHASYDGATGALARIVALDDVVLDARFDGPLLTSTRWSGALEGEVARAYDGGLRLASLDVAGLVVPYTRDGDGLVVAAGEATLTRDAATGAVHAVTVGVVTTIVERDARGRVGHVAASAGGEAIFAADYGYDADGRVAHVVETIDGVASARVFGYDPSGRLTSLEVDGVEAGSWGWDVHGNRTTAAVGGVVTHATYDAQDRLLATGGATWEHGLPGGLTRRADGDEVTLYEVDVFGDLRAVTLPGGGSLGFLIDGRGRRVLERRGGALGRGWLWLDGERVAAELGADGVVTRRFVWASGGRAPDYQVTADGVVQAIVSDRDGSVRAVVDATTGVVLARRAYGPFGETALDTDPGACPLGWAGGLPDADTGFVHLAGRDYDPATGRWTTKAPNGLAAGDLNLYALDDLAPHAPAPLGDGAAGRVCAALAAACAAEPLPMADGRLDAVRAWLAPGRAGGATWRGVDRPSFGPSDLRAPAPLGTARPPSARSGGPLAPLWSTPVARALALGARDGGAWLSDPARELWTRGPLEAVAPVVPGLCGGLARAFCR